MDMRQSNQSPQRRATKFIPSPCPQTSFHPPCRGPCCNNHGVWTDRPATFSFRIAPYFYQTYGFYVLCAASVLAAGYGMHRGQMVVSAKIQRLEHQHALERERSRIAQEMHDDLGASLTEIGLLGELTERELSRPDAAAKHLQKLKQTTREVFRSMDEIVWAVNPKHDTLPSLVDYITRYSQDFLRIAGVRFRVDRPEDLPDIPLPADVRHNLFLAIKQALNNVVRHADASEVWLRVQLDTQHLRITLDDNGCGFDPAIVDRKRSGLANMKERLTGLGGKFELRDNPAGGTRAIFELPLKTLPASIAS